MSSDQKYNFSGKVVLVTGSSSGIGAAIATQFAQYGAKVVITGRDATNLAKVARKIESVGTGNVPLQIVGDLLRDESLPRRLVSQTIDTFGQLDVLVNNAGGSTPNGSLASAKLGQEFDDVFRLNVRVVVELTQLAVPHLEKTRGNIVNISSIGSITPHMLVYSSSKAALDMVTKTSALELGPKGIRVNSINPGPVVTSFGRSLGYADEQFAPVYDLIQEQSLLKQIGQPDDIANLALFLASDDAVNITGSINASDSGALLHAPTVKSQELKNRLKI